jgi:hypothetical protein
MIIVRLTGIALLLLVSLVALAETPVRDVIDTRPSQAVADTNGNLHVPTDYRSAYQFLGSWAVADGSGPGAQQIHVVYASPGTIDAYRRDGQFPDGAVLVKEVFDTATEPMTTGTVSHAQALKGWFVMVKDGANRHPGNKLWGNGWGWSWFDANQPTKTSTADFKAECEGCHVPARASDWIYVLGYPTLGR